MRTKLTIYVDSSDLPVDVLQRFQEFITEQPNLKEHYSYASNDTAMDSILDLIDSEKFDEAEKALQDVIDTYGESPDTVGMSTRISMYRDILSEEIIQ